MLQEVVVAHVHGAVQLTHVQAAYSPAAAGGAAAAGAGRLPAAGAMMKHTHQELQRPANDHADPLTLMAPIPFPVPRVNRPAAISHSPGACLCEDIGQAFVAVVKQPL